MSSLSELLETHKKQQTSLEPMVPARAAGHDPAELCVAVATYEDFDGVYFTLQSLRLHHPEVADQVEFLIIDNHPFGPTARALRDLAGLLPRCSYVPYPDRVSTAARDHIFHSTKSDYVLVLDSHVLLAPGALAALLGELRRPENGSNLLQGPMLHEGQGHVVTHMEPQWRDSMFGTWATDERGCDPEAQPFEIHMHGLGAFACRRTSWPGIHSGFRGFGGEEGYLHEKFRQRGGRVLCVPAFRWLHRFARPAGVPYRLQYRDRFHNYLLGWQEVGWDGDSVRKHFNEHLDPATVAAWDAELQAAAPSPLALLGVTYVRHREEQPSTWNRVRKIYEEALCGHRLIRFPPARVAAGTETTDTARDLLSLRRITERARAQLAPSLLVLDDPSCVREPALAELQRFLVADSPSALVFRIADQPVGAVLRSSTYDAILAELPNEPPSESDLEDRGSLDWLAHRFDTEPFDIPVASARSTE